MYNNGDSFNSYYDPDFVPLFETQFATDELEQQANNICGSDEFCLFDIAASGKVEIGMATKKGSDNFEMLQKLSKPSIKIFECNMINVIDFCILFLQLSVTPNVFMVLVLILMCVFAVKDTLVTVVIKWVSHFNYKNIIILTMIIIICSDITDCTSSFNPCMNGATCGRLAGSVVCMCSQGYIGYYCEEIGTRLQQAHIYTFGTFGLWNYCLIKNEKFVD